MRVRNYLPCIVASERHDQHHSVVPILSRNWKGVLTEEIYSWKGPFVRSAIHGLDKDDFLEQMNGMLAASSSNQTGDLLYRLWLLPLGSSRQQLVLGENAASSLLCRVVPVCLKCGTLLPRLISSERAAEKHRFQASVEEFKTMLAENSLEESEPGRWVPERIVFPLCQSCERQQQKNNTIFNKVSRSDGVDQSVSEDVSEAMQTNWCPCCFRFLLYPHQKQLWLASPSPRSPVASESTRKVTQLRNYFTQKVRWVTGVALIGS